MPGPGAAAWPAGKQRDKALTSFWILSLTPPPHTHTHGGCQAGAALTHDGPTWRQPLCTADLTRMRPAPFALSLARVGFIKRSECRRGLCLTPLSLVSRARSHPGV